MNDTTRLTDRSVRSITRSLTATERLFAKVDASGDCWAWTGSVDRKGYGQFHDTWRTTTGAHRAVYEALVGPLPDSLVIDHLCRNRLCVNPDHLEPVTQAENVRRSLRRAHCRRGHLLTTGTTMVQATGKRRCRVCFNAWHKNFHRVSRAAARAAA